MGALLQQLGVELPVVQVGMGGGSSEDICLARAYWCDLIGLAPR